MDIMATRGNNPLSYEKFPSIAYEVWYLDLQIGGLMHKRGFVMDMVVEEALELYASLQDLGWETLVQLIGDCYDGWVREFYAILAITPWIHNSTIWIWGIDIRIRDNVMNHIMSMPSQPN